ncbi:roadblock/LC7 domain-containing protein [Spirillospora sp. NBC_01491]|uniref:roadblock/LC7 domain-containing protein n=1 Tax=Spirillospora sp. NBC_01491 TaxID=2976007 RepID=UPI002E335DFB|nr:roadblock/LC7 domain-containing protein [Spirillospora sp. NBC_01491]
MSTMDRDLGWLLDRLANRTPGIRHVLVLSKDGLKICHNPDLDEDRADQLAALASGIQSLAVSASAEFGHTPGSGQSMVEFHGGILLIVPAGEGSHLAVITADECDVGLIGHTMNQLVEQIGGRLTAPPLGRGGGAGPA